MPVKAQRRCSPAKFCGEHRLYLCSSSKISSRQSVFPLRRQPHPLLLTGNTGSVLPLFFQFFQNFIETKSFFDEESGGIVVMVGHLEADLRILADEPVQRAGEAHLLFRTGDESLSVAGKYPVSGGRTPPEDPALLKWMYAPLGTAFELFKEFIALYGAEKFETLFPTFRTAAASAKCRFPGRTGRYKFPHRQRCSRPSSSCARRGASDPQISAAAVMPGQVQDIDAEGELAEGLTDDVHPLARDLTLFAVNLAIPARRVRLAPAARHTTKGAALRPDSRPGSSPSSARKPPAFSDWKCVRASARKRGIYGTAEHSQLLFACIFAHTRCPRALARSSILTVISLGPTTEME